MCNPIFLAFQWRFNRRSRTTTPAKTLSIIGIFRSFRQKIAFRG